MVLKSSGGYNISISSYTHDVFYDSKNIYLIESNLFYKKRSQYSFYPSNCATSKLFSTSLLDTFVFPVGCAHEDIFLIPKILLAEDKIALSESKQYFYRLRDGSISSRKDTFSKNKLDRLDGLQSNVDFVVANNIDAANHFFIEYFNYLRFLTSVAKKEKLSLEKKKLKKRLKNSVTQYRDYINSNFEKGTILAFKYGYNSLIYRLVARLFR